MLLVNVIQMRFLRLYLFFKVNNTIFRCKFSVANSPSSNSQTISNFDIPERTDNAIIRVNLSFMTFICVGYMYIVYLAVICFEKLRTRLWCFVFSGCGCSAVKVFFPWFLTVFHDVFALRVHYVINETDWRDFLRCEAVLGILYQGFSFFFLRLCLPCVRFDPSKTVCSVLKFKSELSNFREVHICISNVQFNFFVIRFQLSLSGTNCPITGGVCQLGEKVFESDFQDDEIESYIRSARSHINRLLAGVCSFL